MEASVYIGYHQRGSKKEPDVRIHHIETDSQGNKYISVSIDQIDMYLDRNALPAFQKIVAALETLPEVATDKIPQSAETVGID